MLKYVETEWIRQVNRYGRLAVEGNDQACFELLEKYAEKEKTDPFSVLTSFSIAYMDSRGFGYDEFKKIRGMIAWNQKQLFSTT